MTASEKPQPWTHVHQREARAEALRLSMLAMLADDSGKSWRLSGVFGVSVGVFGANLMMAGLTAAEVQAAIRRVRRLAEGRLVREPDTMFAVRRDDGVTPVSCMSFTSANDYANSPNRPDGHTYRIVPVKVTRIQRAGS